MPFTLAQLQSELQAHGYGTDTASVQVAALNEAVRDIRAWRHWPWQQTYNFGDTLPNNSQLLGTPIPTSYLEPTGFRYQIPNTNDYESVTYLNPVDFQERNNDQTTKGAPSYWTIINGLGLMVWPNSDRAYTVAFDYGPNPTLLVNPGDTVNIPDAFINLIIWGALKHLAFRERDWAAFDKAEAQFQVYIQKASADIGMTPQNTPSEVRRSGFYDNYEGPIGIM